MATITYKGVTHRPNNATSPDGDLALCLNLVNDNGTLTPLEQPTHIGSLPSNMQALFIHQSATYKHIIIYDSNDSSVIWVNYAHLNDIDWEEEKHWGYIIKDTSETPSVTALGNTLILTFKNSPLQYAVWKNDGYTTFGSHPPFIPIQFALLRQRTTDSFATFDIPSFSWTVESTTISRKSVVIENEEVTDGTLTYFDEIPKDISQQHLSNAILGEINKAIAQYNEDEDASFIFPFFVRYAIRLYDGSLTQHSYPVLMIPNSYLLARIKNLNAVVGTGENKINGGNGTIEADWCKLYFKFLQTPDIENWKDLIQGIDIYISQPLYTYDQAGYITGWAPSSSTKAPYALRVSNSTFGSNTRDEVTYKPAYQLLLPTKDDATINSMVEDNALFYNIHSIAIDNIKNSDYNNGWTQLLVKGSTLASLTSRQVMTDDYNSHNDKLANVAMIYNSRLNLADVSEIITADVAWDCQFAYLNNPTKEVVGAIYINDDNGKQQKLQNYQISHIDYIPRYFFFPSTRATAIALAIGDDIYKIGLKQHPGLNGAVYFRGFGDNTPERIYSLYDTVKSISVIYPNKLYTSNVDNPFTFRPENINTIGSGNIRALSAATQAISQGQFGAFPLYAFTDEGIWALAVSGTGGWTSIQPVTRDVITEGTIPLSLDNAIAFFSAKGLMLLQGGDVSCMSAMLDTNTPTSVLDNIVTDLSDDFIAAVKRFPKSAALAYDYAHSRIYALAPNAHWIYSTKLGTWSHAEGGNLGDYALNNYPNTIIVRCDKGKGQHLYSLNDNCEYYNYAEFITRPLHFGTHSLRTIRALVTRGLISNENKISVSLYASMDNNLFIPIAANGLSANIHRISGSAYRSHCLHVIAPHLTPSFAINSTEFDVVTKHSHKLR